MAAQDFLRPGGVTSIGSLPHRDADAACDFVLKHHPSLPAAPQLPRRSALEGMVARLDDFYVYTVDDLGTIVRTGTESRKAAVAQAEAIIETRVRDFEAWWQARATVPVIQGLRTRADALRTLELDRARR